MSSQPGDRISGATLRQDNCARLLLLLSRPVLTPEQQDQARRLATGVDDWATFASIASRKFIASFAYRHLSAAAVDIVPPKCLALLKSLAYASTLSMLRLTAAQLAFHRACITSTGAVHAYMKGPALAVQCGQDPGSRPSRDIDVLIDTSDFRAVLDAASRAGYAVYLDFSLSERATSKQDLHFLSNNADVVTILGEANIPIELHRRLDKQSVNFDLADALATAEEVELAGVKIRTLEKSLHLNYICYHHARHFWSKLHWLADLDALPRAPGFDMGRCREIADHIGILPTLEAALAFSQLSSKSDEWTDALASSGGGAQFLAACLYNLDGDLELEQKLRKGMPFGDFMSAWQVASNRYNGFAWNAWTKRLRPRTSQYLRHRLPRGLHWLYIVRNCATLGRAGLASATGWLLRGGRPRGRPHREGG